MIHRRLVEKIYLKSNILSDMKVALTGATGFVGQNLIPMLLSGHPNLELLTLNKDVTKAEKFYPSSIYPNCTHIHVTEWDRLIEFDPEVVIHLATVTTASNDTEVIRAMLDANIQFGVLLLDALTKCRSLKLFVNTGTFAEYRFGNGAFESAYLYAASKTAFRAFVDYYSQLAGFRYITVVPYSIYGGKMTVKRIMDFIKESMDNENPVDMTMGEQILDFIHIDDIIKFYIYVIDHIQSICNLGKNGEDFHLGTGRGTSIRDVAAIMEHLSGKKCNINWGGRPYRDRDIMYAVAPIAKTYFLTGWKAEISITEGIKIMLEK